MFKQCWRKHSAHARVEFYPAQLVWKNKRRTAWQSGWWRIYHARWLFWRQIFQALQKRVAWLITAANLTQGERITSIRGDSTRWIDEHRPIGMQYLQAINELAQFFNQTLYTGIRRSEAHYARYPAGFGYQWHSDNPQGRDERVLSAVFYLNEGWGAHDGGEIIVIDQHDIQQQLQPQGNRLVIFNSNLVHQVAITHRERFSIATWWEKMG